MEVAPDRPLAREVEVARRPAPVVEDGFIDGVARHTTTTTTRTCTAR